MSGIKGHVAEGVMAAAIAARFLSKNRRINLKDIDNIISLLKKKINPAGTKGKTKLEKVQINIQSPNKNPKVFDDLECSVVLDEANMSRFLDNDYRKSNMTEITNGALHYVNESFVQKFSTELYENNTYNKIQIIASGPLAQSKSKTDIDIFIDDRNVGLISLKTSSEQFGQITGACVEDMKMLFEPLGVKFSAIDIQNMTELEQQKSIKVLQLAYDIAFKQLKDFYKQNKMQFVKNLSEYIEFHSTRRNQEVVMVRVQKNVAKEYKFNSVQSLIEAFDFKFKHVLSNSSTIDKYITLYSKRMSKKIPTILIQNKKGVKFMGIRTRVFLKDTPDTKILTFKSYIEAGSLFDVFQTGFFSDNKKGK